MNVLYKASLNCAGKFAVVANTVFSMRITYLGELVLNILHLLYTWYLVIGTRISSLSNVKKLLKSTFKAYLVEHSDVIKKRVLTFQKIPQHLCIIIGDESPSYKDLVKFITWSVQAGISHISFYEHHNGVDCNVLFAAVCEDAKHYIPYIKWGKSFCEDIKNMSSSHINGYKWKPVITVHVYRSDDSGKMLLKSIFDIRNQPVESVDVKSLDSFLRKYLVAPDPEFAIICGNTFSYFGFPAWCLRVTQFQKLTSHHKITAEVFLKLLEDYSSCKQRWGE